MENIAYNQAQVETQQPQNNAQGQNVTQKKHKPTPREVAIYMANSIVLPKILRDDKVYLRDNGMYKEFTQDEFVRCCYVIFRDSTWQIDSLETLKKAYEFFRLELSVQCNGMGLLPLRGMLCFQNGIYNMIDRQAVPYPENYFVQYRIEAMLDFNANDSPYFDQFLRDIAGDDDTLIERIWEVIGYCIAPDMAGKCFVVFQGVTSSGKSRLGEFISSLFNPEAVTSIGMEDLKESFVLSELVNRRLSVSMDFPPTPLNDKVVSLLKRLTGEDRLSAQVKHKERVGFVSQCKFLFATNHPLLTETKDNAFFDRVVVVPFYHSIPKDKQDPNLLQRFEREKNAIVSKAVKAYFRLYDNHYQFSGTYALNEAVSQREEERQNQSETFCDLDAAIEQFIEKYCGFDPNKREFSYSLYMAFVQSEFGEPRVKQKNFSARFLRILNTQYPGRVEKSHWRNHKKETKQGLEGIYLKRIDQMADREKQTED